MPKRVVYSVSGLPEWVEFAKRLRATHGWEPWYWIAPSQIEDDVRREFPRSTIHCLIDAMVGIVPEELKHFRAFPLDGDILGRFAKYEQTALQIMDRLDFGGGFTFQERHRFYKKQLLYWLNAVRTVKPDLVFFTESPHTVPQFMLYAVCREEGVPTLMFAATALPSLVYVRERIEEPIGPRLRAGESTRLIRSPSAGPSTAELDDYVERLRGRYSDAEPWYMRRQRKTHGVYSKLKTFLDVRQCLSVLLRKMRTALSMGRSQRQYIKIPGKSLENSVLSAWGWWRYRRKANKFKRALRRRYEQFSRAPDLHKNYIYVPLHYQPERTSVPEGGVYGDQWLLVNLIAQTLPDGWRIYVKEHASQFHPQYHGHQGRTLDYYDALLDIPHVCLIDFSVTSFELIDHAQAVATLTGTAGWEGIVRGTPALVFGHAWYRSCPGAFAIETAVDCIRALEEIQSGYTIKESMLRSFLRTVAESAIHAYLNPSTATGARISPKENVDALSRAMKAYLENEVQRTRPRELTEQC